MNAELSKNFAALQQMDNISAQEKEVTMRKILCQVVKIAFTDLNKVAEELTAGTSTSGNTVLQFVRHCVTSWPQIFAAAPHSSGDETPDMAAVKIPQPSVDEERAASISRWMLGRMLQLLSHSGCGLLHDKVHEIIPRLFHVVLSRSPYQFRNLMSCLIDCLPELVKINECFCSADCEVTYQGELKRFAVSTAAFENDEVLTDGTGCADAGKPLIITNVECCEQLQAAISVILTSLVSEICQFVNDKCLLLWTAACCQLEFGDINLKKVSLELCYKLMLHYGLPSPEVLDYYLSCVSAMFDLLCTLEGNFEELEVQLALCLKKLLSINARGHVTSSSLDAVFEGIIETLLKHGTKQMKTSELKQSVSQVVCSAYEKLPAVCSRGSIVTGRMKSLISLLLKEIGTATQQQYLVPCLYKAVKHEAFSVDGSGKVTSNDSNVPVSVEANKGQRDHTTQKLHLAERSSTYKGMLTRLDEILQNLTNSDSTDQDNWEEQLEGIRVIIEVSAWCSLHVGDIGGNIKSFQLSQQTPSKKQAQVGCGVNLLTTQKLQQIQSVWLLFLRRSSQSPDLQERFSTCYCHLVMAAGSFLFIQESEKIPAELSQNLVWMLTLYWLPNDVTWLDLKSSDSREIAQISSALADKIEPEVLSECIAVLSMFPKDVVSKWRTYVLKVAVADSSEKVRRAVVSNFQVFLHHMGPNANHLVYDLLHPLMSDRCLAVKDELARVIGSLACVVSRKAILHRPEAGKCEGISYQSYCFKCVSCDDVHAEDQLGSPITRPKLVNPDMFLPFFQLLDNKRFKLVFISRLRQLFGHIGVRSNNTVTVNMLNMCLKLIESPSYQIRVAFSKVVKYLIGENGGEKASQTDQAIVSKLKSVCVYARSQSNARLEETVILTIGELGRVAEGELLLVVIISLLESFMSRFPLVKSTARNQIINVASHKKMKIQSLFMQFRQPICKFLAETVHDAECSNAAHRPIDMITDVSKVFDFADVKSFIQNTEKFLLPHLVSKGTPAATEVIRTLAQKLNISRGKLLVRNIKHVFAYLVRSCKDAEMQNAFTYLRNETQIEVDSLLRLDIQGVHNELLLYLGTHYQQVYNGLKILASKDNSRAGPRDITSREDMADFLQLRLLGILAFFDSQLLNASIPLDDKKQALESLVAIMQLMGSRHITTVRAKFMSTLRIGLQFQDRGFPELCCKAWDVFVRSVELASLGPMLSQIVVTLSPLLHKLPKQVANIFRYLIVENRENLCCHFHELYFMPDDVAELSDINDILREYKEVSRSQSLEKQLALLIKGLSHENLDVRLHVLSKLKQLLHDHQVQLHDLVMGSDTAHPVVSRLVSTLLSGCGEPIPAARTMFGECLGELGAVDPGRLDLMTINPKEELNKFQASVNDDNFAFDLIIGLARSFLAAEEPRTQDCCSFALQAMLQIYEINTDEESPSSGLHLWKRFPEYIREILAPLFHSRYKMEQKINWSQLQQPIYNSRKGSNFRDWVCTWAGYLVSKVKEEKASRVFQACSLVIKHDVKIAVYLLPHIVVQALLDGTAAENNQIVNEILVVLNHAKRADTQRGSASDFHHMSAQTVFSVLDHLTKWKRHRLQYITLVSLSSAARSRPGSEEMQAAQKNDLKCIENVLERIPQDVLAMASHTCHAFTRSLMHFEQFIKKESIQDHLDFLQKLYVEMNEPDGVAGVMAVRLSRPSLPQQILAHESIGQLSEASACYEQVIQMEPDQLQHHHGRLRCLMDMGQLNTSMQLTNGLTSEWPAWTHSLNAYRVEAAWKLGQWDKLGTFLKTENQSHDWNVGLGKILLAARYMNENEFSRQLQILRSEQMGPLSAASMESGSYQRGYQHIVRLHMLNELEQGMTHLLGFGLLEDADVLEVPSFTRLLSQWESRLQLAQPSFRTQEPILHLRRIILGFAQEDTKALAHDKIGHCWLNSAKVARKAGLVHTAYSSLLNASVYNLPEFSLEKAKWLWNKGDYDEAQTCLEKGLLEHYSDHARLLQDSSERGKMQRLQYAKALLLLARYSEETSRVESNTIVKKYREVTDGHNQWEDGYFYTAKYYDKIMTTLLEIERPEKRGEFIFRVVQNFLTSLQYGSQYIYQSMPRLLLLWLDYGSQVAEDEKRDKNPAVLNTERAVIANLNRLIDDHRKKLAPYQFLSAFSQLISRICHAHQDVFRRLLDIIANMLEVFPQQAMWMMMAVSKSSYQMRVKRCQEIFNKAKCSNPELNKFLTDATRLTDRLLDLCNKNVPTGTNSLSISQSFKPLQRLLDDRSFSPILIPLQSAMTVTLPSYQTSHAEHNPFPGTQVYLTGLEDMVEVLSSLQRPKKITLQGSDGHLYVMLCKPKDDLRKDNRLMELFGVINKCLMKDAESRRRRLHIRTYAVTPLNEECGILEWVPNTSGLRQILLKLYRERRLYTTGKELKSMMPAINASLAKKKEVYKTKLLPRHPPVFGEWFLKSFPDPTSWYNARLSYARTCAVMSMVGYIVGLGDRHGENILLDSTNGDCVHVDFNCLFNKGETFDWPEVVPFRLTHNMTSAMGPMEYEGIFRRACEVTLRLMRDQMDPLMSVLKAFIYDPLVEWNKPVKGRSNPTESGEIKNEKAQTHVQNIESRLKGVLKTKTKPRGLPLSVEGHVNHLIQEATNEDNLCQMYIGWAAYC